MYNSNANMSIIKRLLNSKGQKPLKRILTKTEPRELSKLYFSLNKSEIDTLTRALISIDKIGKVFWELPEPSIRDFFARDMHTFVKICSVSSKEHAAHFISVLNTEEQNKILNELPISTRTRLRQILSYEEKTAGRDMQLNAFCVNEEITVKETLSLVRNYVKEKPIYYVLCVSDDNKLKGVLSLRNLVTASEDTLIKHIMKTDVISTSTNTKTWEVAQLVGTNDLLAIPVLDNEGKLKGVIAVDDIIDIIEDRATKNIYKQAGLQEDDKVYTKPIESIKNRLPWMMLNLIFAGLISLVVSFFEETMSKLIILATLNNIVSGTGGNMGIQTLTVVTRGLATGDFDFISHTKAILKEIKVGISLGLITGICAGIIVYLWKGHLLVSVIICISMILNSFVASIMGATIPLFLKKQRWDPASGSGVLVTTITDCFGFLSFLGIATLAMKYFNIY